MGKYLGANCRLCRLEGFQLMLKGSRCMSDKCAVKKRKNRPGQIAKKKGKPSDYGLQLRAKQSVKRSYGLYEKQFRICFAKADRMKGKTADNLLRSLELRLDNIIYRMHFASSRKQARQIVGHGHILVNGRKINIPSYHVKAGDKIEIKEASKNMLLIRESLKNISREVIPQWLSVDENTLKGEILRLPERDEIPIAEEKGQLIVELYSK